MTQLKDILVKSEEQIEVKPECRYRQVTVKLWGKGVILRNEVFGSEIAAPKRHVLRFRDFLISKIDARNGAFGLVPDLLDGSVVSSDFPVFKLDLTRIYPRSLEWMRRSNRFIDICKASSEGTTNRVRLKEDRFLASEIPLPSLDEQRRIVARIEELVARIEEAQELRRRGVEEMDALKSSAKSVFFSKEFNKQWPIMALSDIADIRAGATLGRSLCGPTIKLPYLRVANVQDGYLDLGSIKEIEILESEQEKWQLQDGDILLTEGGDWDKLGRGVVWHSEIKMCIHQNHIFRLRVNPNEFDPEYLCSLIGSAYGKDYFRAASKQTTNLASINQRQLKAFKAFKPPLEEQRRIIAYVDALQSNLDALKRHQAETANKLDALMPSILNKAFSGEL